MRLIDANALKEKKVYSLERHEKIVPVAEIDWMPTIDAVPVVRCKDCKAYHHEGVCLKRGMLIRSDDWYCADGERKDDDRYSL